MRYSSLFLGLAAVMLASPAMANTPAVPRKLASMDAEAFRSAATIDDDDLEFAAIISTRNGFRKQVRINGSTWGDSHVEAHIDKRTGAARFEVHQALRYFGSQRLYSMVHFEDRDGRLVARPLDRARRGDDVCPNSDFNSDCSLTEKLVFAVDEAQLVAAMAREGGWDLKYKGRADSRDDLRARIVPAEIEGLLLAVNAYRAGLAPRASD